MQYAYLTLSEAAKEATWVRVRVRGSQRKHRDGEVYLFVRPDYVVDAAERRRRSADRYRAAFAAFFAEAL